MEIEMNKSDLEAYKYYQLLTIYGPHFLQNDDCVKMFVTKHFWDLYEDVNGNSNNQDGFGRYLQEEDNMSLYTDEEEFGALSVAFLSFLAFLN
jgi:hypothetical protein